MSIYYIMNYVTITDIFGNTQVNYNLLPFIIIHSTKPDLLAQIISKGTDCIMKITGSAIYHLLHSYNTNPDIFVPLGDFWFPTNQIPKKVSLIMVNSQYGLSTNPIDYVKIDNYGEICIWKPICSADYQEIGIIASQQKPNLTNMHVLHKSIIMPFNGETSSTGRNTNMNEFNLLSNTSQDKYTINRTKFLKDNVDIKIQSNYDGNNIAIDDYKLMLRYGDSYDNKVHYSVQGELKIGGHCIDGSGDLLFLEKCNGGANQKWFTYQDNYVNQSDGKCLTNNDGVLIKRDCSPDIKQSWKTEDYNNVIENTQQEPRDSWVTQNGNRVILIEPDNPWYINKSSDNIKPIGIMKQRLKKLNEVEYRDNANFDSSFMMDVKRPDMGYGYSMAQRKGAPCKCAEKCYEGFDDSGHIDFNIIASSLIFFIFLLIGIRYLMKSRTISG